MFAPVLTALGSMTAGLSGASMALTGLQIAGTLASAIGQNRAANAAAEQSNQAAQANYTAQMALAQQQSQQVTQDAQSHMGEVARQALQERARLATSAGEAGVSGGVLDRLALEIDARKSSAFSNIEEQRLRNQTNLYNQGQSARAQTQGSMDETTRRAKAATPSWLGVGLQIGSQLAGVKVQSELALERARGAALPKLK